MYVPLCEITIGKYIFRHVVNVKIESSRKDMGDTAVIVLPSKYAGKSLAKEIKEGDRVEIRLSYDGYGMNTEFTGYVNIIGCNLPVEIQCEDEIYKLKRTPAKVKSWQSTKLKDVLHHLVPDATLEVPDITLSPFYIKGTLNVATALQQIRDAYGLDVYFRGSKLFAGLAYTEKSMSAAKPVVFDLRKNVVKNDIEFVRADSRRIKLKAISMLPGNKQLKYETGDPDGEVRTLHFYNKTTSELKALADEEVKKFKSDGFKGHFTCFGIPFVQHGMIAEIREEGFEEKNGKYFVDKVTTEYGMNGFRREIEPGRKAS